MIETKVADRYAKALLIFAQESNSIDIVLKDLEYIAELMNTIPELNSMVQNPIIRPTKKIVIVTEIFKGNINNITFEFLILLIKKGRIDVLKILINRFIDQYNQVKGRIQVDITSATNLTENLQNSICDKLHIWTGKEILPRFFINKSIIGGFQVKFADYFYDASVKKQLNNLLTEISK
ncbi:MAG: ATP synthase F1 subunit delta [Ignavibacteria bacterium GWF2_33_9]|nr:MAG: ATP synthase F1 subunit delta [Ignavibacteria bacterium GWF2_33_9]